MNADWRTAVDWPTLGWLPHMRATAPEVWCAAAESVLYWSHTEGISYHRHGAVLCAKQVVLTAAERRNAVGGGQMVPQGTDEAGVRTLRQNGVPSPQR